MTPLDTRACLRQTRGANRQRTHGKRAVPLPPPKKKKHLVDYDWYAHMGKPGVTQQLPARKKQQHWVKCKCWLPHSTPHCHPRPHHHRPRWSRTLPELVRFAGCARLAQAHIVDVRAVAGLCVFDVHLRSNRHVVHLGESTPTAPCSVPAQHCRTSPWLASTVTPQAASGTPQTCIACSPPYCNCLSC